MNLKTVLCCSLLMNGCCLFAGGNPVHLSSAGFLPESPKKATVTLECATFSVHCASTGDTVFQGRAEGPLYQNDVNQSVWIIDFSSLEKDGTYYLSVPEVGNSIPFEIGNHIFSDLFRTVVRAMYLWRCGTAVEGIHDGNVFAHSACHMEDGWLDYLGEPGKQRDGTGGWHDAGDHGKYVVNAGITVANMFMAWDHFRQRVAGIPLDLPETAPGFPEYLEEIKWETDWLLKMQLPGGSGVVSHKLTRLSFPGFIMPEDDLEKRYFSDWSTAATADFAAVMAMAARYFQPYDPEYADTCLDAAIRSYHYLRENPEQKHPDIRMFRTGAYITGDTDDRMWAAAELWETTGDDAYLKDFEEKAAVYVPQRWGGRTEPTDSMKIDENWDWAEIRNLGMFTYLLSAREGRDPALLAEIREDLLAVADTLVGKSRADVYGRPLAGRYYWGCNGTVARQVQNLMIACRIDPRPEYREAALDAIAHLFGRNYYGRSYVTGVGFRPPMFPHDRRSAADSLAAPWPGYLIGGGHSAVDWKDEEESYATNEVAINWQAALIYALAGFLPAPGEEGTVP